MRCFYLLVNVKVDAVSTSWLRFKNQLATLLMIFAIYMSFKWRSDRRVRSYSLRNSFSKKGAHSNMCFQACTSHILHCYTDEGRRISGYILYKSRQLELNHIWPSTYWMIKVQWFQFASHAAQYWHLLKTEWQINRICLSHFLNRKNRDSNSVLVETIIDMYL